MLSGKTSISKKPQSPSKKDAKSERTVAVSDEVLEYYSGEELMHIYKVKQSWLYTTAKHHQIPICRIGGRNYYSKKHVDAVFGVSYDMDSITDWITANEVEELYSMKMITIST